MRTTTLFATTVGAMGVFAVALAPAPVQAGPSINPSTCGLTDISLTIGSATYNPTQCRADVEIAGGNSNPTTERDLLNAAFSTNFSLIGRAENSGSVAQPALDGIQFTLSTVSIGSTSGTFTLAWADANGSAPDNLPISIDFALMVNGGSNGDGYLFQGVTIPITPTSGTGNFTVTFHNGGNNNNPGLSHLTLIGGDDVQINPVIIDTPEPATLAILGMGMIGLGAVRRRRRA